MVDPTVSDPNTFVAMVASLSPVFVGIISGAVGYLIATFWVQPILKYRDVRKRVLSDFIYYAQVINADGMNVDMEKLHKERTLSNRETAAELSAAILYLPTWYLLSLEFNGRNPKEAARHLVEFSNTFEYDEAAKIQHKIRKQLGLPKES